jgi:hypothetical protein
MSMSIYMSNSAPLHDFSIQLSLLKAPGVEPDSQGLARVELAAVAKAACSGVGGRGQGQLRGNRRSDHADLA